MLKKLLIIPAIVLMSQGVFADDHGQRQPPPQDQDQGYQEQGYQEQGYNQGYGQDCGGGCGGPVYAPPPCGYCGGPIVVAPPPPPPPPPVYFNPGINYYCGPGPCVQPIVPYGPPPVRYIPPPFRGGPIYGRPPIVGRPGYGGPGWGARPMPRGGIVRRMSATGCEVQPGNSGEFLVISAENAVLYQSDIKHAEDNAEAMKTYYENHSDQCGGVRSAAKSLDI